MLPPKEENAGLTVDEAVDQPRVPTRKEDGAVTEGLTSPSARVCYTDESNSSGSPRAPQLSRAPVQGTVSENWRPRWPLTPPATCFRGQGSPWGRRLSREPPVTGSRSPPQGPSSGHPPRVPGHAPALALGTARREPDLYVPAAPEKGAGARPGAWPTAAVCPLPGRSRQRSRPRSGWALAATAEGTEARAQQVTGAVPLVLDVEQRVDSAPDAQWVEQVGQVLHGLRAQSAASEPRGAAATEDAVWPVRPTGRSAPRARLTWAVTPTAAGPTRLARTSQLDGAEHTREETGSGAPATGGDCCPSRTAVPVCVLGTQADVR